MSQRQPIIGLCGGIGAGKSAVAAAFGRCGAVVISSDALNHAVLRDPEVARQVAAWFGEDVLGPDGTPDRARLAEVVFGDAVQRRRLEGLVHPLIARRRADIISRSQGDASVRAIILDSPLLFESQLDRLCDAIVFVEASEPVRLERLRASRQWDLDQLRRRERCQLPLDEKRRRAQFVVNNNTASPDDLLAQVSDILSQLDAGQQTS